ncbi:MAG TPA: sialidase family protein [Actinoplanes sp.]|nr:sialidase family protein [Actinoplanes sp.]
MLESQFDRLRAEVGEAVRQPDFDSVRDRAAVRKRRRRTAGVVIAVLVAAGFGFAVNGGPAAPDQVATVDPKPGYPRLIWLTSAGNDLYALQEPRPDSAAELHVSSDGGASWESRDLPPMPEGGDPSREGTLTALSTRLVVWRENNAGTAGDQTFWTTRDSGRNWAPVETDTTPVESVPDGVQPVDCGFLEVGTCTVGVIAPDTGRFAPLAGQPTGITLETWFNWQNTVPLDGRLWLAGVDPDTGVPVVATSSDRGRTWYTHVFTDAVPDAPRPGDDFARATRYVPKLAAGSGGEAYLVTVRSAGVIDVHRTTDGGVTWQAGDTIQGAIASGFVAADGTHVVPRSTGFVAGRGTGRYTPVTLRGFPGNPAYTVRVSEPGTTAPYVVASETAAYRSENGLTWQQIRLP